MSNILQLFRGRTLPIVHLRFGSMRSAGFSCLMAAVSIGLSGCSSQTFRTVDMTPPTQLSTAIPEPQLLDIGVAVFDPNVPEEYDERISQMVNEEVRRAESHFIPYTLKSLLESTGNWGAVRVVPSRTNAVDVTVSGEILTSHGERLALSVRAEDARGIVWFEKTYETLASKYAYDDALPPGVDPFQDLYTQIANDMAAHFAGLSADDRRAIRLAAEMRFARDLAPVAYRDYVEESPSGQAVVKRLPARNDPTMKRVRKVRDREFMFIDALDGYYAEYRRRVLPIYQVWRRASYGEVIARLKLGWQRRERGIAGTLSIVGGVLGGPAGWSAIGAGADMLKKRVEMADEAGFHAEALREVSDSMEQEVAPHTLTLDNGTVRLSGTVDKQFDRFREIIRKAYVAEYQGL